MIEDLETSYQLKTGTRHSNIDMRLATGGEAHTYTVMTMKTHRLGR